MSVNGEWRLFTKDTETYDREDIQVFDSRSEAIGWVKGQDNLEYETGKKPGTLIGYDVDGNYLCVKFARGDGEMLVD